MVDQKNEKEVLFADEARAKLLEGVKILAQAVEVTLGPKGQNVIIHKPGQKHILTKDGVTVAKHVNLNDPYLDAGAQVVKEVAQRTNEVAGDGTTTATTIAHSLFAGGMKLLSAGYSGTELKKGMEYAQKKITSELISMAIDADTTDMISSVGTISANGEKEIGELLSLAMEKVGRDGVITVEQSQGIKTTLDFVEGAKFDRGYFSSYFITDSNKMTCELENPLILISNLRFNTSSSVLPLLEAANRMNRSILFIADEVDGELLQLLVTNHMRGILKCCAIKAPGFGEQRLNMLNDLATLTGGQLVTTGDDLNQKLIDDGILGTCNKVVIDKSQTLIIGASGEESEIKEKVDSIHEKLKDPTISKEERMFLQQRLSKMAGGVAIIKVGGATELEMEERKYRVEDALNATTAAAEEGIVPGGGSALVMASRCLIKQDEFSEPFWLGVKLVKEACFAPIRRISSNAAVNSILVEGNILNDDTKRLAWDARNDVFVDALDAGIIDPVKVTRTALENAVSVSSLLLTTNACVIDISMPNEMMLGL